MATINWGIIGAGDVTELKSGPAFNKVPDSALVAIMRRNAEKAADYAQRHGVPAWYTDASELINDPRINAIYVATPPSSHEEYTIAALKAGKPVYVEKPMSVNAGSAQRMKAFADAQEGQLVVAHYRRAQPFFKKIRELLLDGAIGEPRLARMELYKKALTAEELAVPKTAWRVDAAVAGGGLFHDLAPHQLDLMYYFFGEVKQAAGVAHNQGGLYTSDDIVSGHILFESGVQFNGSWCFTTDAWSERDCCEIIGEKGRLSFSVFGPQELQLVRQGHTEKIRFDPLLHVQQPMIEEVVNYFLNRTPNPCTAADGVTVMQLIDRFTAR